MWGQKAVPSCARTFGGDVGHQAPALHAVPQFCPGRLHAGGFPILGRGRLQAHPCARPLNNPPLEPTDQGLGPEEKGLGPKERVWALKEGFAA